MVETIKIFPPYKPLVQLRWCCAACCIQWVLFRRGFWVDQEEIARYIELKVPKYMAHYFTYPVKTTRKKKKMGTSVHIEKQTNKMFREKKIPLKIEKYNYEKIKDYAKFIVNNLKKGNDIMLDFHWYGLGKRAKSYNFGHVCVVAGIELNEKPTVILGDPSYNHPKYWKADLKRLVHAMDPKYDGYQRGFWIIKKR